jgi:hypothetical protein
VFHTSAPPANEGGDTIGCPLSACRIPRRLLLAARSRTSRLPRSYGSGSQGVNSTADGRRGFAMGGPRTGRCGCDTGPGTRPVSGGGTGCEERRVIPPYSVPVRSIGSTRSILRAVHDPGALAGQENLGLRRQGPLDSRTALRINYLGALSAALAGAAMLSHLVQMGASLRYRSS